MDIRLELLPEGERRHPPAPEALGFGDHFSNHMFLMDFRADRGWINPRIVPYAPFRLDPAAMAFHYGQAIFEGLKAYRGTDGRVRLFRARANAERFNRSARRLCMPELDEEIFLEGIRHLVRVDADWVPKQRGNSLYIRPLMIATEPHLGVRPAEEYLYAVILSPVGAYYAEGFDPVRIYVTDKYVRAAPGGVGEAKTAGNYAASLMASEEAKRLGFTQVLWLDAVERRYVEEVGTMNIFFLLGDELVTPPLGGTILPGITRDSVLRLTRDWGLRVSERRIAVDEVFEGIRSGVLRECFGSGTAAVISPVGSLYYKGVDHRINGGRTGELARRLFDEITGLQYGDRDDPYGWIEIL
ncbi:branched-chain amino acid aminotransferase [Dissulfurirhabdus thermomarina]|uniref:Branched-chain-amino-acid aminotransferase n=1 Tax=Dissulfurirhabdus thermomarina TaxID=1765737 RepID=A0A6N9TNW3_DISTH|nr:branched-chain amino acid aminotransferase [Dissulfurirhabdus thermomarina]NDY42120.1 branched-chain amino acid aminotransferase [Dissulfurirhabdus thermomarina]NMX22858.1 branched-chain amino acid aminotransferase [Dissulfurirhabdus thermomarina]